MLGFKVWLMELVCTLFANNVQILRLLSRVFRKKQNVSDRAPNGGHAVSICGAPPKKFRFLSQYLAGGAAYLCFGPYSRENGSKKRKQIVIFQNWPIFARKWKCLKTSTFAKSARFQMPKNGTSSAPIKEQSPKTPRNTPQNGGADFWFMHFHSRANIGQF